MTVLCDLPGCGRERIEIRADDTEIEIRANRDRETDEGRFERSERAPRIERVIDSPPAPMTMTLTPVTKTVPCGSICRNNKRNAVGSSASNRPAPYSS